MCTRAPARRTRSPLLSETRGQRLEQSGGLGGGLGMEILLREAAAGTHGVRISGAARSGEE